MAPLQYFSFRKVPLLLLCIVLFFFTFILAEAYTESPPMSNDEFLGTTTRRMLEIQKEDQPIKKKTSTKNQTKLIKPTTDAGYTKNQTKLLKTAADSAKNLTKLIKLAKISTKNQTKPIKLLTSESTKNKTKLVKPTEDSTKETLSTIKTKLKKLNSTSKVTNSTKPKSNLSKKSLDLIKSSSAKNKTTKPISPKQSKTQSDTEKKPKTQQKPTQKQPNLPDQDEEETDDLVAEFRDLPSRFQETLLPDLERISTTSKVYLTNANKQITRGVKPIVGTKYAPTIAAVVSFAFVIIPLLLVSLLFTRIKAYFSLQKLLIFIQVYLSIYFSILCMSSIVTGLEPLRFFYATSQSTYVCLQVMQTLGYVLYLLLLLMYLVLVFSTDTGPASKMLGLGQTFVGFAVGLHYYVTVFHRVVLRQPPRTNWKVHGIYATCFLVICLLASADTRKKAYLEYGGEEAKKH